MNHLSYFSKMCRICCVNTRIESLKVLFQLVLIAEIHNYFQGIVLYWRTLYIAGEWMCIYGVMEFNTTQSRYTIRVPARIVYNNDSSRSLVNVQSRGLYGPYTSLDGLPPPSPRNIPYVSVFALLGPFHGAIAVPSVTRCCCRCRCRRRRRRRGHRCAGGL